MNLPNPRVLACTLAIVAAAAASAPLRAAEDWTALATTVAGDLTAGRFAAVEARFDSQMTAALPPGKLAATWSALVAQVGPFGAVTGTHQQDQMGYHVVLVTCTFARAALDLKLVFDGSRHLAGLFFVPSPPSAASPPPAAWSPPPYARPSAFRERALIVGGAPWELPGTLTLPVGKGPFPAVVLVQGSGPQDADETIGPNKPFKDLAWGLATRGVAVLRFPKRTQHYQAKIDVSSGKFTVAEETVDDARAAVELAARQPEIDGRRVFVLGHSLGGTLAPRIAKGEPAVAGLVLLAGGVRPLERAIVEQLRYLASLPSPGADAASIQAAEQAAREIASPTLAPTTMVKVLGTQVPGSYFLDLRGYDPPQAAAALHLPVLVLQAERDYQVTTSEYQAWKVALANAPHPRFEVYPGLFHLFMPSTTAGGGLGSPADYGKPGHVVEPVIAVIAEWIASLARPEGGRR